MGQLHYFLILALCLLMTDIVYSSPRSGPRLRPDLAKATLITALNDFDSLLAINEDMARIIRELKEIDTKKNYQIISSQRKANSYLAEIRSCQNEKENLKVENYQLEQENRCLTNPVYCFPVD